MGKAIRACLARRDVICQCWEHARTVVGFSQAALDRGLPESTMSAMHALTIVDPAHTGPLRVDVQNPQCDSARANCLPPTYRQPSIVDIQILRAGQLVILCVPGEFTTMSGRRLRQAVYDQVSHPQASPCIRRVAAEGSEHHPESVPV
jgi:hypothetical protein